MQYRTKVIINGAEILDEQSETASSITNVKLTESCGQGFQIGSTASSSLSFTMLKPYKESFDGDKVELYILQANAEDETTSLKEKLEEEVGDSTETLAISDDSTADAEVETEETEDPDEEGAEDMTDEEVAEAEAEWNELGANLYEFMNGEEVTDEAPGTETEEEAITWECIGAFYVYSQTNNTDGSVTLLAYDGFSLMNGTYTPSQKKGTFQEFYDDLRTQCAALGVTVDEDDFTDDYNPALTWDQVCSYRTAFGYLAGLQGGFGTFDGDDTLGISYYGYSGELFLVPDLLSYSLTSAGETEIDGVICTINLNQDTVGTGEDGQSLKFYNPFMTEEQANAILTQYRGVRYYGAAIKAKWDSDLLAGDLIRVMSSEEYKNYVAMMNSMANSSSMTDDEILELKKQINAVGKSILISSQTISFTAGGETIAEITSYLPTESEKANAPLSPSDAKFRTVTADLIQTKELIADKASITDLEAVTGRVTTLESETVKASELDAKVATIVEADIKTAEIDGAQIKDATITNAKIDSINGEKITDGSIVAAALSKEAIETLGGNTVYYQATEPTGGTYAEGDIWYKTVTETSGDKASILYVYDGTAWVNKPFDSESILAKSITAGEIASGTITTGEINMDNLQTNIARIGDAAGKHVQIDEDSVDITDGQTTLASYGENITLGEGSTIEGDVTGAIAMGGGTASGSNAFAMGYGVVASGKYSIAEGFRCEAVGDYSHAEGDTTKADGGYSHAEGYRTTATGMYSHAEGARTESGHVGSHAEGGNTTADGGYSHAEGYGTVAKGTYQHVEGVNNVEDKVSAFIIGNGEHNDESPEEDTNSNAFTVDWDGNVRAGGTFKAFCKADSSGGVGLVWEAGDSYTVASSIHTAGYVTSSSKSVRFSIPLSKPVASDVTSVTISNLKLTLRQGGKYTHGSSATTGVAPSSITASVDNGFIMVNCNMSSTTNAVNNDVIGISTYEGGAKPTITFS